MFERYRSIIPDFEGFAAALRRPRDLVLLSRRAVVDGAVREAMVHVREGKIAAVGRPGEAPAALERLDLGDRALLPGLVDVHVHVNEPGRTEWEGFETATRAAAAGGITTIVDMPLNAIPATTSRAGLDAKLAAAGGRTAIDWALWGGVVPGSAGEIAPLARAGLRGFKCFLVPSGVDEFPSVSEADLREAMPILARLGSVLLAHAELPGPIERAAREPGIRGGDPRRHATWLASRPRAAENEAIALLLRLASETGCRVHIVHLSSSDALGPLRAARRAGLPITVETCPHYLTFAAEEIPDGATAFKCAPPIREGENRERLWQGLREGTIDLIATDHSPCPPAMKEGGDFFRAWGGIASLELSLSAIWTGASARGLGLEHVTRWMCERPAELAGVDARKGAIAAGRDADLVVFDPEAELAVDPAGLHQRHKVTPYAGRRLRGRVETVFLRGERVYDRGGFPGPPRGMRVDTGIGVGS